MTPRRLESGESPTPSTPTEIQPITTEIEAEGGDIGRRPRFSEDRLVFYEWLHGVNRRDSQSVSPQAWMPMIRRSPPQVPP